MGTQMLIEAFNDIADLQRMKDHNYAIGGKLEDVGRIATNANQEHNSVGFKEREDKKKNEAMLRLLRQQELMKELDGMLDDINGLVDEKNENTQDMLTLAEIYENNDSEALREYLTNKGITPSEDENELWEQADEESARLIENDDDLSEQIDIRVKQFRDRLEDLDKDAPDYQQNRDKLEQELGQSLDRLYDSSNARERLNVVVAERNAFEQNRNISILKERMVAETVTRHQDQEDGAQANIVESTPTSKSGGLFGDVKSIKNEYNAVASGESLEDAVEENLESDLDNSFNQPSVKGLTI